MSTKKKQRDQVGMPQSSAGLMRFFQDETNGPKLGPEFVMASAIILVAAVIIARTFFAWVVA